MAMQMNRTGVFLIAFFGLFGLAMIVAPISRRSGLDPRNRSARSGSW